jgi:hypothetical protein
VPRRPTNDGCPGREGGDRPDPRRTRCTGHTVQARAPGTRYYVVASKNNKLRPIWTGRSAARRCSWQGHRACSGFAAAMASDDGWYLRALFESGWHVGVGLRPGDSAMGEWQLRQQSRRSRQVRERRRRHRCGRRSPRTVLRGSKGLFSNRPLVAAWDGGLITRCSSVRWAVCVLCAAGSMSLACHNNPDGSVVRWRRSAAAPDAQRRRQRHIAEHSQRSGLFVGLAMCSMRSRLERGKCALTQNQTNSRTNWDIGARHRLVS